MGPTLPFPSRLFCSSRNCWCWHIAIRQWGKNKSLVSQAAETADDIVIWLKEIDLCQFYSKKEESSHGRENATGASFAILQHSAAAARRAEKLLGACVNSALWVSLSWLLCCLKRFFVGSLGLGAWQTKATISFQVSELTLFKNWDQRRKSCSARITLDVL